MIGTQRPFAIRSSSKAQCKALKLFTSKNLTCAPIVRKRTHGLAHACSSSAVLPCSKRSRAAP
jgi:hypothetical protein